MSTGTLEGGGRKKSLQVEDSGEERFRMLVEKAPLGIVLINKDQTYEYVNPRFTEIFGYSLEDLPDRKKWLEVAYPDPAYRKKITSSWKDGLAYDPDDKKAKERTSLVFCKDGHQKTVQICSVVMEDGRRMITYQDVTERRRTEEKLAAIHRMAKELSLTLDIERIVNMAADVVEEVLKLSKFSIELLDEEKGELYVRLYRGFPEGTQNIRTPADSKGIVTWVLNKGQSLLVPDVLKDERYVAWVPGIKSELCVPLKIRDKTLGVLNAESERHDAFGEEDRMLLETLASEVTIAIKNARLYEELELSKTHFEFLNDLMSHDISNMNQIALGYVEMLSESELSEKQRKFLNHAQIAVMRSGRLVKNVKTLKKMLEDGEEKEKTDLSSIMKDAIDSVSVYPGKKISIEWRLLEGKNILASSHLTIAFENLLDNAIKFTQAQHVRIAIELFDSGKDLRVEIKDWGQGISDQMKESIFRRFERLSEGVLSTGLGLYVAKRIVENHSGKIWVRDNEEGGSVFCVELPLLT